MNPLVEMLQGRQPPRLARNVIDALEEIRKNAAEHRGGNPKEFLTGFGPDGEKRKRDSEHGVTTRAQEI